MKNKIRLTEIFFSLQGETKTVGLPTVFIRLTGCPLRCQYCDTAYAFHGGKWHTIDEILQEIKKFNARYVTVTGGEPLVQKSCLLLMRQLCDQGYQVSLETSGALDVSQVDSRVTKVIDIKTPGSGEVEKNHWENISMLTSQDQVKFVICNKGDYEWAKQMLQHYHLSKCCEILFSPSHQQMNATELAEWILQDQLPVRMQIQLHKYLWGHEPGR